MAIQFKVACTAREIDDALWLRHQVYVMEEGLYGGRPLPEQRMFDRFDILPKVAHIIAYDDDEPIAGIRVNCDMGLGVPPERHFDFSAHLPDRTQVAAEVDPARPVIVSAGMLVVRNGWRRRRDVTRAIYGAAISVFFSWNATHVIGIVSARTASLYRRMGFYPLAAPIWNPEIGDHIVPLLAKAEDCYRWAFGEQLTPTEPVWRERRKVSCNSCHGLTVLASPEPPRRFKVPAESPITQTLA